MNNGRKRLREELKTCANAWAWAIGFLLLSTASIAQTILNGSFENHAFSCGINLRNETINGNFPGLFAFGNQSEIDILKDSCGYGSAIDGEYFIALYHRDFSDAFSLQLSEPLADGRTYLLNFSAKLGQNFNNQNTKIEIGLSDKPDQFGDLIFTSEKIATTWQNLSFEFTGDAEYSFLTVRIQANMETWTYLDNF
ncbi:MAG: hypothetical protein KDC24_12945, partial [Saprospiraceae bacterium]|nr:hypothetical protein [Saprospiraceae bacterium]